MSDNDDSDGGSRTRKGDGKYDRDIAQKGGANGSKNGKIYYLEE